VERILERFPLEVGNKTVMVKPNMLGPYPPESHVNTHPSVIEALVESLRTRGATVVVGDNPGTQGYGAVEKSGKVSGIIEASAGSFANLSLGVQNVRLPDRDEFVNVSRKIL
jgi:uncharacterized protein (DUF362 family)